MIPLPPDEKILVRLVAKSGETIYDGSVLPERGTYPSLLMRGEDIFEVKAVIVVRDEPVVVYHKILVQKVP